MKNLPARILEYVKEHYPEADITKIQKTRDTKGHSHYRLELSENEAVHHLNFSAKGRIVDRDSEARFEEDYEEGDFYGTTGEDDVYW